MKNLGHLPIRGGVYYSYTTLIGIFEFLKDSINDILHDTCKSSNQRVIVFYLT